MTDADLAILMHFYSKMEPARQREFWQIVGTKADKLGYLLRWGSFEVWQPKAEAA